MADNDQECPPGSDRQWWFSQGPETCVLCEARVHPEMLTYCFSCDQGICIACYRHPDGDEFLCAECGRDSQEPS